MKKTVLYSIILILSVVATACRKSKPYPWEGKLDNKPVVTDEAKVGEPLPAWSEGYLDIHAISTGRGECTFFILPDGTTMCIDAGEIASKDPSSYKRVSQMPNDLIRAYITQANYMLHFLPKGSDCLDYMLLTHFHNDHFGTTQDSGYEWDKNRGYRLTGMLALYDRLHFAKLIDRLYPDYSTIDPNDPNVSNMESYIAFTKYNMANQGLQIEKFDLGSTEQIRLLKTPENYPDFKITNYASNGVVWSPSGEIDCWKGEKVSENGASCCILLSYGDFDYLTCGDAGQNGKIENPLSEVINHRLEAMKAHHHMSVNTMTQTAMNRYLPKVVVTQSFYIRPEEQPNESVYSQLLAMPVYSSGRHFYFTNIDNSVVELKPMLYGKDITACATTSGHIVIRVAKDTKSFMVYVLDDTDTKYTVKQIDGPFTCYEN